MVPDIHYLKNTQVLPSHLQGVCSITLRFVMTVGKAYKRSEMLPFDIEHVTNSLVNGFLLCYVN